jgi:hypothetical protein
MTLDPKLLLTFKDYQHAHILIESTNFDAAPKAKFLYHVVFGLTAEARRAFPITDINLELLSVLAKTVVLPSYTASIDTINQYNRKKKYQTKIDYRDINVSFYDDNAGVSRSLLEGYYKYYFREATKNNASDIGPRDKFSLTLPKYGLDNQRNTPFFEWIKIFQLSKHKWFCYTLVNPIISQWSHDELAYAEAAGITENRITVGYEAVLYTKGNIDTTGEPSNFGNRWYDQIPGNPTNSPANNRESIKTDTDDSGATTTFNNEFSGFAIPQQFNDVLPDQQSVLRDIFIPRTLSTTTIETTRSTAYAQPKFDSQQITDIISSNRQLSDTLVNQALATGSYSGDWNSNNFSNFKNLDSQTQEFIRQDIVDQINTNVRIQRIASTILNK